MSTIAINYSELRSAAGQAKNVSKRLDAYADSIENTVLRKLDNYSGDRTGNISSAISNARNKRNQLQDDCRRYSNYSNDLKTLESDCQNTDKRVADRVKGLTGTFKSMYGIKTNAILDHIGRFMTSLSNSNSLFRWIGNNVVDRYNQGRDYLKDRIKEWYNYDGGKQLIKGVGIAILEIVGAIAAIAAVVLGTVTGVGALIAAVAAVIGGVIGILNGAANLINEVNGYNARQNGNASWGYRLSKLDTYTDSLRTFSDDKGIHMFANIVDGIEFVCDVIDFVDGAKDLIKNGYKWASGNLQKLDNLKLKDILTKSNIKDFTTKLKTDFADTFNSVKSAFARKDLEFFKRAAKDFGTDFMESLKERYLNFDNMKEGIRHWSDSSKNDGLRDGLKSLKNLASLGKEFLSTEGLRGRIGSVFKESVLPCINVMQNPVGKTDASGSFIRNNGRIVLDSPEKVSIDDIWASIKSTFKIPFSDSPDIYKKFIGGVGPNISVPKIYVPQINLRVNLQINIQPIHFSAGLVA
ncbi:hypothetical protein IMSAGC011_01865 [Lachnospiraceae bacterium]|nr:hypothetical protein IMSAGC011_01865 [Lachnospiraceae bacterium]